MIRNRIGAVIGSPGSMRADRMAPVKRLQHDRRGGDKDDKSNFVGYPCGGRPTRQARRRLLKSTLLQIAKAAQSDDVASAPRPRCYRRRKSEKAANIGYCNSD